MQTISILIVITTLMISVCDSLPKYCQCIESNGNQFNAFAEYFSADEEMTEFWLYQNKHRCRMYVNSGKVIMIDTSGEISPKDKHYYRLWFGFYRIKEAGYGTVVHECRAYPISQSEYAMECRIGDFGFVKMFSIDSEEYSNALIVITENKYYDRQSVTVKLPVIFLFQNQSKRNWIRNEKTVYIKVDSKGEMWNIRRDSNTESNELSVLLKDIGSNVYINAVLNAYDAKHDTKGFFIFVTNNGIPMYCYKSSLQDRNDSCSVEKMIPFMSECFQSKVLNTTSGRTEGMTDTTTDTTDGINIVWIFIAMILIAILFTIPFIICLIMFGMKTEKSKSQRTEDKKVSEKIGKESKVYPKYLSKVSNDSNISSKSESKSSETQLKSFPFEVNSKHDLQKTSEESIKMPTDLVIRKKK